MKLQSQEKILQALAGLVELDKRFQKEFLALFKTNPADAIDWRGTQVAVGYVAGGIAAELVAQWAKPQRADAESWDAFAARSLEWLQSNIHHWAKNPKDSTRAHMQAYAEVADCFVRGW